RHHRQIRPVAGDTGHGRQHNIADRDDPVPDNSRDGHSGRDHRRWPIECLSLHLRRTAQHHRVHAGPGSPVGRQHHHRHRDGLHRHNHRDLRHKPGRRRHHSDRGQSDDIDGQGPGRHAFPPPTQYTYLGRPVVTSVTPNVGPGGGGNTVTIHGSWFTATTAVTFGGSPGTTVVVAGPSTLTAVVPAGTAGTTVPVVLHGPSGASTGVSYTYGTVPAITSISPDAGPVAGGTTVLIVGPGITATATVTFGGVPGTTVGSGSTELWAH